MNVKVIRNRISILYIVQFFIKLGNIILNTCLIKQKECEKTASDVKCNNMDEIH